jgi:hypothetical protein
MTDPTPEPSPEAEGQNASQIPPGPVPPGVDPQEILNAIGGIDLDAIEADIESAFGSRMAELDKMLAGLDDLVSKIEKDIQNLDQPKPDGPQ